MTEPFLSRAYTARSPEDTRMLYDDRSASYDARTAANDYGNPDGCAKALAAHVNDKAAAILDFGFGTGLSGLALNRAGLISVDGVGHLAAMLAQSDTRGVYRTLAQIAPCSPPPGASGDYAVFSAIRAIVVSAAPIDTLDLILHALGPGGECLFSTEDPTQQNPLNEARASDWWTGDVVRLPFRKHGDHLPEAGINTNVYTLKKS